MLPRGFVYGLLGLALSGCVELSPFETDLDHHERDLTDKQLARLGAQTMSAGVFSFALISDSHEHFEVLRGLVDVFNARDDLAFVAHLGDMTNMGLRREFRATVEQLEELDVPYVTVLGNHDALSHGRDIYRSMFGPFNYTFRYGGVHFVGFNANALEFPGEDVPDLEWLQQASAPQPDLAPVIVLSHQPLEQDASLQVLSDNGVLATFGAHIHSFGIHVEQGVLAVTSSAARAADWVLVSVDGTQLSISECSGSQCTPRLPP